MNFFDLKQKRWTQGPLLNNCRDSHSSCCLGQYVYVFAGDENGSIESLQVEGGKAWQVLAELTLLNRRLNPAVAVLNERAIAVFGGFYYEQQINSGIVFDTEQKTC